jgi:hypothetical protein
MERLMASFETELTRVRWLMKRLNMTADEFSDPNNTRAGESGADVIVTIGGRRIGVQVTDLDTGDKSGAARATEARLAKVAAAGNSTYGVWAQNDTGRVLAAIERSVTRKTRMSFAGFDEFWLLICAGVPSVGAVASTFVMTPCLPTEELRARTGTALEHSNYTRTFLHAILGVEEQALYEWERGKGWSKSVLPRPAIAQGPSLWEYKDDPELLKDPKGWCDREVERVLAEMREAEERAGKEPAGSFE